MISSSTPRPVPDSHDRTAVAPLDRARSAPTRWARIALRACATTLILAAASPAAHARLARDGDASVAFHASATGGMKIRGTTQELDVGETDTNVVVTVPLAGLRTGIALRDKHLREKYLETAKYPNAVLTVERRALRFPAQGAAVSEAASGTLTLHGHSKAIRFAYGARRSGDVYLVRGAMALHMEDFKIEKPSFLGVVVRPEVTVEVEFRVKDSQQGGTAPRAGSPLRSATN